ncbi:hypothetical protein EK21DRAFT_71580 [Setomelanomma holmii]|uniref:WSC domain-containing protein n=1 Tax=Setomelanomma holmii TaxID=210430 RepID=A0A9P4H5P0_9PLEO|nr:hypothetical protein EK21DRAFT_71580 [Setomelanomma holmii]
MSRRISSTLSGLLAILAIILLVSPARAAWTESYCSSQNTGSTDVCHCGQVGNYAFAVIQLKDCYCSNYIPSQQVDVTRCDKGCPGFPSENCGDIDNGLYIYIKMSGTPSGTIGASSPSKSAVVSSSPPPPVSTQAPSSSQIVTVSTLVSLRCKHRSLFCPPSLFGPSCTAARHWHHQAQRLPPVRARRASSGTSIGAIVGGVLGGLAALAAIVGLVVFFLLRKRKQNREAQDETAMSNGGGSGGITRNTSTMSRAGLLGGATQVDHQYPPPIATNFSTQNSRYGDHESISPISNRRNSQPLMIDSRLNPNAVITFAGANASRESVASLDDSRDYGRQLNVRNPDPSIYNG